MENLIINSSFINLIVISHNNFGIFNHCKINQYLQFLYEVLTFN